MGAKMSAMDYATRNAGDMIDKLTLTYNRSVRRRSPRNSSKSFRARKPSKARGKTDGESSYPQAPAAAKKGPGEESRARPRQLRQRSPP